MTTAIVVLMKDPARAKTRLSPVLDFDVRAELALSMFRNTVDFLRTTRPAAPVAVVSSSDFVGSIATQAGCHHIQEPQESSMNFAAGLAARWAVGLGAARLLVVHADIPALIAAEFDAIDEAAKAAPVVVARSHDGGSNAVMLSPPDAIPFCFGRDSAASHMRAAQQTGLDCSILDLDHLSRDLDTPGDLKTLCGRLSPQLDAFAVTGLPEFSEGDDLPAAIIHALARMALSLVPGDIVVIAQKVVSKVEGRLRRLDSFSPTAEALTIGADIGKDPRKVEAILRESVKVLRKIRQEPDGLLITRHRKGWICANAGIDESNLGPDREGFLLLLPEDPDQTARVAADHFRRAAGGPVGVVISDTFGRPWRHGLTNIAVGCAEVPAVVDWAGSPDASGRVLKSTAAAFADEIASAAGLLMLKDAQTPVVIMRNLRWNLDPKTSGQTLLRPFEKELFV